MIRAKIYDVIEPRSKKNKYAIIYDISMICIIIISFIPLFFKKETAVLEAINLGSAIIFIIDYILRWITADFKFGQKGITPFLRYPFSIMAIVDILSIMPGLIAVNPAMKMFRAFRLIRALRIVLIFKAFKYSGSIQILVNVFRKQRRALIMVLVFVVSYIVISALVIFQVEPDTFDSFFEALYWATTSLTTIGYGDIYAVSPIGKLITMISVLMGVAIIALPSGIITAGYISEIEKKGDGED